MKKVTLLLAALALVLGTSQCKKPNVPKYNDNNDNRIVQNVTLNTTFSDDEDNSKVDIDGELTKELKLKWEGDEKIYVYDGTCMCGTLDFEAYAGEDNSKATFKGAINPVAGSKLRFYHFNGVTDEALIPGLGGNDVVLSRDYSVQNAKAITDIIPGFVLVSDEEEISTSGSYDVTLGVPFAVVRTKLSGFGTDDINMVGMSSTGFSIGKTGALVMNETTSATLTAPGSDDLFLVLMPKAETKYMFGNMDGICEKTWTIDKSTYYTKEGGSEAGDPVSVEGTTPVVTTIPVFGIHSTCATSGGVVTGGENSDEQGVIWAVAETLGTNELTLDNCTGKYIQNGLCPNSTLTPKTSGGNTFSGFMSNLATGVTYKYRAYIKIDEKVVYGETIGTPMSFTTPSTEPFPTGIGDVVNFGKPNLYWSKYNLGYDPSLPDGTLEQNKLKYYGDYYLWGDNAAVRITGDRKAVNCVWQSYRYSNNNETKFTRYSENNTYWYGGAGSPDHVDNLGDSKYNYVDDCARQTLGGDWRLPTHNELKALCDNNTFEWLTAGQTSSKVTSFVAPVTGELVVKGKGASMDNSVYMFIPAAGRINGTTNEYDGTRCRVWSNELYGDNNSQGWDLEIENGVVNNSHTADRCHALSVRPVRSTAPSK